MNESEKDSIIRHIRGAIVVHQSPFSSLEVPSKDDELSLDEDNKWVSPFYRVSFRSVEDGFTNSLKKIYPELTPAIIQRLLTEYDWRPRLVGAFFAALKRFSSVEDQIGRLLLRSDLCFAGKLYCVALTEFNTPTGMDYLKRYLEYYLTRPDLDYDQDDAMGALAYLDALNGARHVEEFRPRWDSYVAAKSWKPNLEQAIARFAEEMKAIHQFREQTIS